VVDMTVFDDTASRRNDPVPFFHLKYNDVDDADVERSTFFRPDDLKVLFLSLFQFFGLSNNP